MKTAVCDPSAVEVTVRNGVRVKVTRFCGGTTVEADCQCFGAPFRAHSTTACPLFKQQKAKGVRHDS